MNVASSSDADTASLHELLNDYEWNLMQSETSDTSIDNASIYLTSRNTSDIVQLLL